MLVMRASRLTPTSTPKHVRAKADDVKVGSVANHSAAALRVVVGLVQFDCRKKQ
jgi:hypothetical protein